MTVVADVSGIAQILFQNAKKDRFETIIREADVVLAPDLYVSELSNTLWKYCVKGLYTPDECTQLIDDGLNYIDEYIDSKSVWEEVFRESVKAKHPVYDMLYAIISRKNEGVLMTNDEHLVKVCKKLNIKYCY